MPKSWVAEEIVRVLEGGGFDELVGTTENLYVEVKGEPYRLSGDDWQKQELAKDVSALANSAGGVILLGFRTKKDQLTSTEEIDCCRPFEATLFDIAQYRNVLEEWVHPAIHPVQVTFYPSASAAHKGVGAIIIPPNVASGKPYVVTRAVASDGRLCGTMIGYYERILDRIPPTSVGTLRSHLKDGMRFTEFSDRLTAIEVMLGERLPPAKQSIEQIMLPPDAHIRTNETSRFNDVLNDRIAKAMIAVERAGRPNLILAAISSPGRSFPGLFESQSAAVVKLLENQPVLRRTRIRHTSSTEVFGHKR